MCVSPELSLPAQLCVWELHILAYNIHIYMYVVFRFFSLSLTHYIYLSVSVVCVAKIKKLWNFSQGKAVLLSLESRLFLQLFVRLNILWLLSI